MQKEAECEMGHWTCEADEGWMKGRKKNSDRKNEIQWFIRILQEFLVKMTWNVPENMWRLKTAKLITPGGCPTVNAGKLSYRENVMMKKQGIDGLAN